MSIPNVSPGYSLAHRIVTRVAVTPLGRRFIRDVGARIDPTLIRLTRGWRSSTWPFSALLLTHVGAKSGTVRTSALAYFTDQGRVVLMATNFGSARNPNWYHNVRANPVVQLYGRGIRGHFMAEEVYGAERDRIFRRAKDAPSPYAKYEAVAAAKARSIPVVTFIPQ